MTDEEIVALATEYEIGMYENFLRFRMNSRAVDFARRIEAATIERCAKIVDPGELTESDARCGADGLELMQDLAAAIRARGEK